MNTPRSFTAVLVAAAFLLVGCGVDDEVRNFVDERYQLQNSSDDTATYSADTPVGATTAAIVGAVPPAARQADGGSEYLRYEDDIVIVSAAPAGSTVHIEDLDDRYRSGHYVFLGPGFTPGSPAGGSYGGGPGGTK